MPGVSVGEDILITIKPRHLRNMKRGRKKYELRKTRPKKSRTYRIWCCESGTGGKVVAVFTCGIFPELTDCHDAEIAKWACITEDEARGYRQGGKGRLYGWLVEDFEDIKGTDRERHISNFGRKRPPQSWCYCHDQRGGGDDD